MLLRQTIRYLPAQVVGPVAQVVATIVWTHWLTPAPYGLLTFIIAGQELVYLLGLSWWTHYTMRYIGGFDSRSRHGFERSEAPVLAASLVVQSLVTLVVVLMLREPMDSGLVLGAVAYSTTRTLLMHICERARVEHRVAIYTGGQLAGSLLGFVLALMAVAALAATPEAVLLGYAVAQLLGVVWMWRALRIPLVYGVPSRATLIAALRYGGPLLVAGGFTWLAQNALRLVIEPAAGAAALGLVAVGWGLGQRLAVTLSMLVVSASFPLALQSLHGGSREGAYRQLALGGSLLMGLTVPASVGFSVLAGPFVTLFVAAPFRDVTIAILPLAAAAGAIRNIRMHIADPVFLLVERPRINTAINIIDTLVAFAGCGLGLVFGGLVGAVVGALVGTCLCTCIGFVMARRLAGFAFPFDDAVRIAAASALMAVVLLGIPWSSPHLSIPARMVIEIGLGAAVYAVAIMVLFPAVRRLAWQRIAAVRS